MTTSLLDLPGKLRNYYIYELHADDYPEPGTLRLYDEYYLTPPLARVSRQVWAEFLSAWDAAPRDITWLCDLERYNGGARIPGTDRITFLFIGASKIAQNVAATRTWSAVDFTCWNDVDYEDPKVTITADFDWKDLDSIGVQTAPHRQAVFHAQPTSLEEIVRKRRMSIGQRLGGCLRERIFRAWLMGEVCGQEESDRRRVRAKEEGDRRRAMAKSARLNRQGMKRKRLEEDSDGVEETWDEW